MLVHRRVTPSSRFAGTHLYTWVERGTMRVTYLAQEDNAVPLPGLEPGPPDPEFSVLTISQPRLQLASIVRVIAASKFCRKLVRFQITRKERRFNVSKLSLAGVGGMQNTTRKCKNIARTCKLNGRFESLKIPIFSTLTNTGKLGNFEVKNRVLVHRNSK